MIIIRPILRAEKEALSELILRSKAHWGYDADFMALCRDELVLTDEDWQSGDLVLAEWQGKPAGMAQLVYDEDGCALDKLFVDPDHMGRGIGKALLDWAIDTARAQGAMEICFNADPQAEAFYLKCGAQRIGLSASSSIKGRSLPKMILDLHPRARS